MPKAMTVNFRASDALESRERKSNENLIYLASIQERTIREAMDFVASEFICYTLPHELKQIGKSDGVYVFCQRKTISDSWTILYVGKSTNLQNRIQNHIYAARFTGEGTRVFCLYQYQNLMYWESMLISLLNPKFNKMR